MMSVKGQEVAAIVGGQCDAEALVSLKDFLNKLGSESLCTEEIFPDDASGFDLIGSCRLLLGGAVMIDRG